MKYICYTADSNYSNVRRPFLFILGKENTTSRTVYDQDTLRFNPRFINYYFVYLPGRGTTPEEKLSCIDALVSLVTYNFKFGRANIFFEVEDSMLKRNDINFYGLNTVFKKIRLKAEESLNPAPGEEFKAIQEEFSETATAYKPEEKVVEDLANYYSDDSNSDSTDMDQDKELVPKKTYFGAPTATNFTL